MVIGEEGTGEGSGMKASDVGQEDDSVSSSVPTQDPTKTECKVQDAAELSPEEVVEFMSSIGLEEYKEIFLENDMNGAMMLEANYDDLAEIGIDSRLHQVKILTLFKRKYSRNEPALSLSVDDVAAFLKEQKLEKFVKPFTVNGIDGSILEAILARKTQVIVEGMEDVTVADKILQEELGMKTRMQRLKVKANLEKYLDNVRSNTQ